MRSRLELRGVSSRTSETVIPRCKSLFVQLGLNTETQAQTVDTIFSTSEVLAFVQALSMAAQVPPDQ